MTSLVLIKTPSGTTLSTGYLLARQTLRAKIVQSQGYKYLKKLSQTGNKQAGRRNHDTNGHDVSWLYSY